MSDPRNGEEEVQDEPGTSRYARKQESAYEDRRASLSRFPQSNSEPLEHQEE